MKKFLKDPAIKIPVIFFLVTLFVTSVLTYEIETQIDHYESDEFKTLSEKARKQIQTTIESYMHPLQGIKGLIASNDFYLSQKKYRIFSEARERHSNFPGALGFGFIRYLDKSQVSLFLKDKIRQDPSFHITSKGNLSEKNGNYFVIELIEPIEKNRPALGLDIGSEHYRRVAAEAAMKTGVPTITHKIELVQVSKKQPGFLLLYPIYKNIYTPESENERIKNFYGWAYTPLLFKEILEPAIKSTGKNIIFSLYEVSKDNKEESINDSLSKAYLDAHSPYDPFTSKIVIGDKFWIFKSKYLLTGTDRITTIMPYVLFLLISFINFLLAYFIYKNISLRLTAENVARAKENELQTIINNIPLTISYWNKNQINVFSNNHYINVCGKTPEDLRGSHISSLFGENESFEVSARVIKALSGVNSTFEKEVILPHSHETRIILIHFVPSLDLKKEIDGFFLIGTDITELKIIQKETDRANALAFEASKQATLGEMANGIAHEINNPLSIIKTLADSSIANLKRGRYEKDRIETNFAKISSTIERIVKIVKGLKLIAKNTDVEDFANLNVYQVLRETLDVCSEKIKYDNIELRITGENELYIFARESEISQVFFNLISNAIEAVAESTDKWIQVSISSEKNKACIKFSDSGAGIPKENLDKIFLPFFTTKQKYKKAGLGLSISKRILEEHKGDLLVDLTSDHTVFIVEIPLFVPTN